MLIAQILSRFCKYLPNFVICIENETWKNHARSIPLCLSGFCTDCAQTETWWWSSQSPCWWSSSIVLHGGWMMMIVLHGGWGDPLANDLPAIRTAPPRQVARDTGLMILRVRLLLIILIIWPSWSTKRFEWYLKRSSWTTFSGNLTLAQLV